MIFEVPSDSLYLTTDIRKGQLPAFLEKAVSIADIPAQKDMLLMAALTAVSYALPHIRILHGKPQHIYSPNLMTLISAPPASGKGVMNNAELLLEPINEYLRKIGRNAIYSGDFSSSSFINSLAENGGELFMIQTEMDKMGKNWKQGATDYSDMFRQAFEHETIRKTRSAGPMQTMQIDIKNPRLSVLLSGTLDQLKPLIGNGENGLASRFMPYMVEEKIGFDPNVLGHGERYERNGVHAVYKKLAKDLYRRWEWLSGLEKDVLWSLTAEQSAMLGDIFSDAYNLAFDGLGMPDVYDATVKRMLVIILRIGAILTALRLPVNGQCGKGNGLGQSDFRNPLLRPMATSPVSGEEFRGRAAVVSGEELVLYCSDEDFRTLVMLSEKLLRHAGLMVLMLNSEVKKEVVQHRNTKAAGLLDMLPTEFTTAEAVIVAKEMGIPERTLRDRLKLAVAERVIKRTTRGKYCKI